MDYSKIITLSKSMAVFWRFVALSFLIGAVVSLPAASLDSGSQPHSRNSIQTGDDLMDSIYSDCLNKGSVSCVKYKLFSFVDKVLSSKDSFSLTEGVTVVKTASGSPVGDGAPRALTQDDAQTQDVETLVANRVERFLKTHSVKIDLKGSDVLNAVSSAGRALGDAADTLGLSDDDDATETGRKKAKKAGKILLPLLLLIKLKALALLPLALGAIALIAGKALLIGKIALLLSAIIALKKLLSGHQKTVTYEIVSHPHHSTSHEHHGGGHEGGGFSSSGGDIGGGGYGGGGIGGGGGGGHGGWGRSADAQEIAYRAYAPTKQ